MSRQARNQGTATSAGATRQNEYFVPRDGIDREVISADICRYLGNDALVRPGHYENPQSGQVVQGYYITAYRNLTTAMIEDLKADSARWDSERRSQTARNTSGVQYRYSETHQSRQHHGPTDAAYVAADPYPRESAFDGPRYPGTGAPGYTGAAGSYAQQQQQSYASSSGGAFAGFQQAQQSPQPDPRYASPAQAAMYAAGQDSPYIATGANNHSRGYPPSNDPYAGRIPSSAAAAQQAVYATAAPTQSGYPASAYAGSYGGQVPQQGGSAAYAQPHDPFYGRASPAGQTTQAQQGYATQAQQSSQHGSSTRPRERESDRHSSDRHHRTSRR